MLSAPATASLPSAVAVVQMATIPADGPISTFTADQGPVAW